MNPRRDAYIEQHRQATLMRSAAEAGDVDGLRSALAAGMDVDARFFEDNRTALCIAVVKGRTQAVEFLLASGANPSGPANSAFEDPLSHAAQRGQLHIAELLLDAGASIVSRVDDELSPLHFAAGHGRADVILFLIERGAPMDLPAFTTEFERECSTGATPLLIAARMGHAEAARALVAQGADAAIRSAEDFSPVEEAARRDHATTVMALLDAGVPSPFQMADLKDSSVSVVRHVHSKWAQFVIPESVRQALRARCQAEELEVALDQPSAGTLISGFAPQPPTRRRRL